MGLSQLLYLPLRLGPQRRQVSPGVRDPTRASPTWPAANANCPLPPLADSQARLPYDRVLAMRHAAASRQLINPD